MPAKLPALHAAISAASADRTGDFDGLVDALLDSVKSKAESGFTLAEVSAILHESLAVLIAEAKKLANPTPEQKQLVLSAMGRLFDAIAPAIPMPFWLSAILKFAALVGYPKPIRSFVLALLEGVYDSLAERITS